LQSAVNPFPAAGGDAPESADHARQRTPLTVLTLDRVVSLQDYEDFARSFEGIDKALATWTWDGRMRRIVITVAGPNGNAIPESGETAKALHAALLSAGDPRAQITVVSYRPVLFELKLSVTLFPERLAETVRSELVAGLTATFGFAARQLGQPVHHSEIVEVVHRVEGVMAVDVQGFRRSTHGGSGLPSEAPPPRLPAFHPRAGTAAALEPAELLLLATESLTTGLVLHQ
jgi:predicted phage baseplate assembly protein